MKKYTKHILVAALLFVFLVLAGGILLVQQLAQELDTKFYAPPDSVPTKVFSSIFWLSKEQYLSLDELTERLQSREYQKIISSNNHEIVLNSGNYFIQDNKLVNQPPSKSIYIFTKAFNYPDILKTKFFNNWSWDPDSAQAFMLTWQNGKILQIKKLKITEQPAVGETGIDKVIFKDTSTYDDISTFALEPVLVAQLIKNTAEARKRAPLGQIPNTLLEAIVSVEDQRFLEHGGVDLRGILRSIYINVIHGGYRQGASTITQQLVRNIYLSRTKTISRKVKEMIMAILMEYRYSKDEILEKYLNEVYLGQSGNLEIHGVAEAAKFYFGKSLQNLTIAEQALLAGLVRGPFYYSPYRYLDRAKTRQEFVLKKMLDNGAITQNQYNEAVHQKLKFIAAVNVLDKAPYFTDYIKAQFLKQMPDEEVLGAGYKIYTTLDFYYQKLAEQKVEEGIAVLEKRLQELEKKTNQETAKPLQAVFIAVDPKTAEVKAIVGGRSYSDTTYNRALLMKRQVGSTFKPFVYLTGLIYGEDEHGPLSAISKLEDSPFTYEYDQQKWTPQNYEDEFLGSITVREALAKSVNIPTARLAIKVGIDKIIEVAKAAGIDADLPAIPSLALGSVELSPMDLVRAYETFANYGLKKEVSAISVITDEQGKSIYEFAQQEAQVLPMPEVAYLVNLLTSTFQVGTAAVSRQWGFTYPAAGKTGTTNDFRDSWFIGFTPQLFALSWVGFDRDSEELKKLRDKMKLTGANGALPIWTNFMKQALHGSPATDFTYPDSVLRTIKIDPATGARVTGQCPNARAIDEVFIDKNAPRNECQSVN